MASKIHQNIVVVVFLGVILFLNILSVRHKTPTYDEAMHYKYGMRILKLDSDRSLDKWGDSKMPFSCLNAISHNIKGARYITVLFSLLFAFYIFKWTKELYGFIPGLFSLVFYSFSPNIIAHSRLITTDLYATGMITVSTYYFWKFTKFGGWKRAGLSAFTLGLSQLAKYTCIYLYPIFVLILLIRYSDDLWKLMKTGDFKHLAKYLKVFFKFLLFFVVISITIINVGFLFNKSFTRLGEYEFRSDLFKSIQSKLAVLRHIPVPFPYPYIEGLDRVKFSEDTGITSGNMYLLGKLRGGGEAFKGYYFYAFLFKAPISIQLFILFSIAAYIVKRKRYDFLKDEAFLICPILFFTIYFNFLFRAQVGIRFFLVVFPFLYIFCGSLFKNWETFGRKLKASVIFLIIYLIASVMSYFPHYLSYFNEFVWDRRQAYKILADSNIDWGQNRWYLKKYQEKHPDAYINPESPVAGRIVVEVNRLVGLFRPERYKWLRDNFEPSDHIAYSYLVYDISSEELEKIRWRYYKQ